jgi:hypothetical protein
LSRSRSTARRPAAARTPPGPRRRPEPRPGLSRRPGLCCRLGEDRGCEKSHRGQRQHETPGHECLLTEPTQLAELTDHTSGTVKKLSLRKHLHAARSRLVCPRPPCPPRLSYPTTPAMSRRARASRRARSVHRVPQRPRPSTSGADPNPNLSTRGWCRSRDPYAPHQPRRCGVAVVLSTRQSSTRRVDLGAPGIRAVTIAVSPRGGFWVDVPLVLF